jgi:putative ABC transport system substrate-binding protein
MLDMMRRKLITLLGGTLLGGAAANRPLTVQAQQRPGTPVIGFLSGGSADAYAHLLAAFRKGLAETGYVEGRNVAIEYRWAEGSSDRLPALASDLVQRPVAVIATTGTGSALAAKAASATIPMVFLAADDPVKHGLVASLDRPGGNATGLKLSTSELELTGQQLELARELVGAAAVVAVLLSPFTPESEPLLRDVQTAARAIGQPIHILNATIVREIDAAFDSLVRQKDSALLITNNEFYMDRREQIIALAARHAVPTIYDQRAYAAAGGLISYGAGYTGAFRRLGVYTARILDGTKPADLPVEQSTFELVINLKTAKALGLDLPARLIARADEVIE